ncbi:MAG: helicase-associated domain-containing protein [Firmicutes bacterium]|nr:helicase-associated domain-containing protein [Bacillota bacterium]
MDKAHIEQWLMANGTAATAQGCAEGTGLTKLHQQVYGHKSNVAKARAAQELAAFYTDEQNILDIWNGGSDALLPMPGLNEAEKKFIALSVQYGGREFKPSSKKLAAELGLAFEKDKRSAYSWSYSRDPFDSSYNYGQFYLAFLHLLVQYNPNTKAVLLFPGGKQMPSFVLEALKPLIPPFEYEYSAYCPGKNDYLICREDRLSDFAAVVRFAGSEALKVKQYSFDLTKAKLARMAADIGFEEVCDGGGTFCAPKEAKRVNDFKIAGPLFALCANSGLVDIAKDGEAKPGARVLHLLAKPTHMLAKQLFEDYIRKNNIYETHYITYISVYDGERWVKWQECREPIITLLKTCPAGAWVDFSDFEKYAAVFHGDFFRKLLQCSVFVQGYPGVYGSYTPDWDECDAWVIRTILTFLGTIGVLDLAYSEKVPRFKEVDDDTCVALTGFRITPLGAWLLGMRGTYEAKQPQAALADEGGLIAQPDHTVLITGMKARIEHEPSLSKYLTKVSSDERAVVYKLDFSSIVRAFNQGVTPKDVQTYLQKASAKPLPANVIRSLEDWQAKAGRVRIRTVTLLEADDALLLQELIHLKGVGACLEGELTHAAVIAPTADRAQIKAAAEKNGWLVDAEIPTRKAAVKKKRRC